MPRYNLVSISTKYGYKNIEIHHNDLSKLSWRIDALVISAYKFGYNPTPNTLIESLQTNMNIRISELANTAMFDFRKNLNSWISMPLFDKSYEYIICLEGMQNSLLNTGSIDSHFDDLFSILSVMQHKGKKIESIALPFLGAGRQGIPLDTLIPVLLKKSGELLNTFKEINTLYLVHPDIKLVKTINNNVNIHLKRPNALLHKIRDDEDVAEALNQLSLALHELCVVMDFEQTTSIEELSLRIKENDIRIYEFGILARRALERILKNLLPTSTALSLSEMFSSLRQLYFAPWMLSALHTARIFSNFLAHENEDEKDNHKMSKEDYLFFIQSLIRSINIIQKHLRK